MRQIHITNNKAPKLRGDGPLEYQLWVDDRGGFFVQIEENPATGNFSPLLFSVAEYAPLRNSTNSLVEPVGLDPATGAERASGNTNDGGFLKAVLCHLLDGGASA